MPRYIETAVTSSVEKGVMGERGDHRREKANFMEQVEDYREGARFFIQYPEYPELVGKLLDKHGGDAARLTEEVCVQFAEMKNLDAPLVRAIAEEIATRRRRAN